MNHPNSENMVDAYITFGLLSTITQKKNKDKSIRIILLKLLRS